MLGELRDDKVIVGSDPQIQRLLQRGFGVEIEGRYELSLLEAVFLMDRGTIEVEQRGRQIDKKMLYKKAVDQEDFHRRYEVYRDLRTRGYVVKTGFKFGAHFRVYDKGEFSQKGHSSFLVHTLPEDAVMSLPELARIVRLTQSVKKRLVFAVVDSEADITYFQIDRIIP